MGIDTMSTDTEVKVEEFDPAEYLDVKMETEFHDDSIELDEKADALQDGASQFEKSAGKLKNRFWMENIKMIIIGGLIGLLVLGLIYWNYFASPEVPPPPGHYYPPPQKEYPGGAEGAAQEVEQGAGHHVSE